MKCSDCPAFKLSKQLSGPLKSKESMSLFDSEQQKKFGKWGICTLFNSLRRERDYAYCDQDSYLEEEVKRRLDQIKLIEKIQKHIEDRKVRCGKNNE